jgi:signal transduction histidine kinase
VVKTLVDFSRPVDLKLATLDLRALAARVAALAAPEAGSHQVEIVQQTGERPLPVRVDADLMQQAILNVVINGVQAMPGGGTLTLRAFASAQAAVLEVQDTGGGIAPEIREKIFNLYFTTKPSGSGIGLALTYRAMQMHNGVLEIESEPQRGSTFRFLLPLASADAAQAAGEIAACDSGATAASGAPESPGREAAPLPPH